jgi:hypothetical protein
MGLAARPLEQDAPGRFRHMIHDEVDKWVDKIIDEVFVDGKEPTLMELSQLFCETKREFFGANLNLTLIVHTSEQPLSSIIQIRRIKLHN